MHAENIANMQKLSQGGVELVLESTGVGNKYAQNIAIEVTDCYTRVFEEGTEAAVKF